MRLELVSEADCIASRTRGSRVLILLMLLVGVGSLGCASWHAAREPPRANPTASSTTSPTMPAPSTPETSGASSPLPETRLHQAEQSGQDVQLEIATESSKVTFGEGLNLTVTMTNRGERPVTVPRPEKSTRLYLVVSADGADEAKRTFGQIVAFTNDEMESWGPEPNDEVELPPGGAHAFTADVAARWPFMFPPGSLSLSVLSNDVSPEVRSNVVRVRVEFTQDSFDKLLQWVDMPVPERDPNVSKSDDGVPVGTRAFAARWLRRFMPGFRWFESPETQEQRQQNAQALSDAQQWLEKNRNGWEVRDEMRRLNPSQ